MSTDPRPPSGAGLAPHEHAAQLREYTADILARTLWGEARGEGLAGMEAVASVVMNRLELSLERGGMWWGRDIAGICLKPWQFSCWNRNDPNRPKLEAVQASDRSFEIAQRVARRAIAGLVADATGGATHYHHYRIRPVWAGGESPTAIIGNHVFYRLENG